MAHLENKLEWCINKAKKEGEKHRGIKEIEPDSIRAEKHIAKAEHNLNVMIYLLRENFHDWTISCSFYAMYHCLLAILIKHGYESKNQECTFTAVEFLIKNKKIDLDVNWLRKIATFDDKMEEEEIIKLREEFQYGTDTLYDNEKIKKLLDDTKEFIDIVKNIIKDKS